MAQHLNLELIAEGVETEQHLSLLNKLGCNEIQGCYFSRLVPADEFEKFLDSNNSAPLTVSASRGQTF